MISTRSRVIIHLSSFLIVIYSLTLLLPMLVALIAQEQSFFAFAGSFLIFFPAGLVFWYRSKTTGLQLQTRDGFLVIAVFWLLFSVISAMPFWLDDHLNMAFEDALFEGVSGITTTGASVFHNVTDLPRSVLYYRAQLNFIGGLGVIVLAVAIFPLLGIGGMRLYQSEMPGPFKDEKLTPRLASSARNLWFTYLLLGFCCTVAFKLAGMTWFDALCHGLSTVSLGGFSTYSESIGYFNSSTIELVAGAFSLLSAVNFTLYFVALAKRSLKPLFSNTELRFYFAVAALIIVLVFFEVWRANMYSSAEESFVHAFFLTSSMLTDNGLATGDYAQWPSHIIVLLLFASFFGGCVGSTCGGIKAIRFLILSKQSWREVYSLIHPKAQTLIKVGDTVVQHRLINSVLSFFFLYVICTCFFIWCLNLMGYDLMTSFASVAACINNMGLGFGLTAPGFGEISPAAKYLLCFAMLLGRLEIYTLLVLLSVSFWRNWP